MLTPVEMQGRELKQGRGYQKKEVDEFLAEIFKDYERLYRENMELKDKVNVLNEGLKYYKDLEKTLQKTLVVAEKTAEETIRVSEKKADAILMEAQGKATEIIREANKYFEIMQSSMKNLEKQYESYRIQCKSLAEANLELLKADAFKVVFEDIREPDLEIPAFSFHPYTRAAETQANEPEESARVFTEQQDSSRTDPMNLPVFNEEDKPLNKERRPSQTLENDIKALDNDLFEFLNLGDDE